jgi:tRNA U34 5-methylaminomethyl-2-thiouridine-forming methyltransferase MnmC
MDPNSANLIWQADGSPRSARFDDPYFSASGGRAESEHVFLTGNGLPQRLTKGFHIAELGFGTGLNMLAAWQAWQKCGAIGPLRYTGFEAFPLTQSELRKALAAWPELASLAKPLIDAWPCQTLSLPDLELELVFGDARTALPAWQGKADAWFLDGFSPSKNPEMWAGSLMVEVARHTAAKGSFATYTAAGHVRRALAAAGFEVSRIKGFGRKRHMSIGHLLGR